MTEANKKRFWVAITQSVAFSETDHHIFRVWPTRPGYYGNKSCDLMGKFCEADNLENARQAAHWFIDKYFNECVKVEKENGHYVPPPSQEVVGLDSLTIDPEPGQQAKSGTDGLLNLGDLV